MYDLKKPSENQKYVESLDKICDSIAQSFPQIQAAETKENVRVLSSVEYLIDS